MAVTDTGTSPKPALRESLCVTCANAVPQLCGWVDRGDMTDIEEYAVRVATGGSRVKPFKLYAVLRCARYRKGPLPELPPPEKRCRWVFGKAY